MASPPIVSPCFYGIDMSTRRELVAPKFADLPGSGLSPAAQEELAKALGADSLRYLSIDALARSIGLPADSLCRACVTGDYPSPTGQRLYQIDAARSAAVGGPHPLPGIEAASLGARTYE